VTKSNPPDTLLRAIGEVMAGRVALSPDIDHELAMNRLAGEPSAIDALSKPAGIRNSADVAAREIRG
jgi:two-component system invasion response regulator UvrY